MREINGSRRAMLRAMGGLAAGAGGLLMGCGGGGGPGDVGLADAQALEPTQDAQQARRGTLYSVTDIGSLGGSVPGVPEGLNDRGDVVGSSLPPSSLLSHAFLYQRGKMTDLGTLGDGYSVAHGINERRQVVGEFSVGGLPHAFLRSGGGVMQDLSTLGGLQSIAYGINDHGDVVGNSQLNDNATVHAFVYSRGVMHDLDPLGTYRYSSAMRINDKRQIAGAYSAGGGAFLYSDGVYRDLGTLGGDSNLPNAINKHGQIAGQARTPFGAHNSFNVHAVVFRRGQLTDLHPAGYSDSTAMGINDDGDIVGTLYANGLSTGFLHRNGVWSNLNDLLDVSGVGWTVSDAWRINNDGQIVALGVFNDALRMVLLTPSSSRTKRPETSALVSSRALAQLANRADAALAKSMSHADLVLSGRGLTR